MQSKDGIRSDILTQSVEHIRYKALVCDFDGTLAKDGAVPQLLIDRLKAVKRSGRKVVLASGRELPQLLEIFPAVTLFDRIVAENGALLYDPSANEEKLLCKPPTRELFTALATKGVTPISAGKAIVATFSPHENAVLQVIRELGLEMQVVFNKGAVMILPSGVNKASGLIAALEELDLSIHNCVCIGDAENDNAMLSACELGVAVANAVPALKQIADHITKGDHGNGVFELIEDLLANDLSTMQYQKSRNDITIGSTSDGRPLTIPAYASRILICGPSGSGKTLLALSIAEQINACGYQTLIVDPEHDFEEVSHGIVIGAKKRSPELAEVARALQNPRTNLVLNLLNVPHYDRPQFFSQLVPVVGELNRTTGHPHWLIIDEAHYLMPANSDAMSANQLQSNLLLLTVHPQHLDASVLKSIDTLIVTRDYANETIQDFCNAVGSPGPEKLIEPIHKGEYAIWNRHTMLTPQIFHAKLTHQEHHRHIRKYAEGDLGAYHSFYFTGPLNRLNLKAQNLQMFLQISNGIDDDTWMFHLRRHDYSQWFAGSIRDPELAEKTQIVEADNNMNASKSQELIRKYVESMYCGSI